VNLAPYLTNLKRGVHFEHLYRLKNMALQEGVHFEHLFKKVQGCKEK
jgi:hypothetical protein